MDAILSGPAGLGVVTDNSQAWLIRWDEPEFQEIPLAQAAMPLRGREGDLRAVKVASCQEALMRLSTLRNQAEALNLLFFVMDNELDQAFRQELALALEELLREPSVLDYLAGVLYSRPLPDSTACTNATIIAKETGSKQLMRFLTALAADQNNIAHAKLAWDQLPDHLFATDTGRPLYLQTAVEGSLFYHWVQAAHSGSASTFDFEGVRVLHSFANHGTIVQKWAETLQRTPTKRPPLQTEQKFAQRDRDKKALWRGNRGIIKLNADTIKKLADTLFSRRPLPKNRVDMLLNGLRQLQGHEHDRAYLAKSSTGFSVRAKDLAHREAKKREKVRLGRARKSHGGNLQTHVKPCANPRSA